MKTTIYELLGMIKDNKAPKTLVFKKDFYEYVSGTRDYYCETTEEYLFDSYDILTILNDEVEILETTITYNQDSIENNKQDKIEKLEIVQEKNCNNNWKWKLNGYNISTPQKIMGDKINEIIEAINER